jgi:hypothetical protein
MVVVRGLNLDALKVVNFDQLKAVGTFKGHLLPAGLGVVGGLVFLFLGFKAGKFVKKLVLFLIAVAFFGAAYWWYTHIRS